MVYLRGPRGFYKAFEPRAHDRATRCIHFTDECFPRTFAWASVVDTFYKKWLDMKDTPSSADALGIGVTYVAPIEDGAKTRTMGLTAVGATAAVAAMLDGRRNKSTSTVQQLFALGVHSSMRIPLCAALWGTMPRTFGKFCSHVPLLQQRATCIYSEALADTTPCYPLAFAYQRASLVLQV